MQIIRKLGGDQLRAKYGNGKFYFKEFTFLLLKSILLIIFSMAFFLMFFLILTPQPTKVNTNPIFQVKKSSQNSMITIFTNKQAKSNFCNNQSTIYFGQLYTKQQYCQFQHENFPSKISNHQQIDITLTGMNNNVDFITGCVVKISQDRSVCQKFAYTQKLRIFNNIKFEDLYTVQIQLDLKKGNDFFGQITVQFQQENPFIIRIIKDYYFFVSIFASIIMTAILTISFVLFQIPQILEKASGSQKKLKQA